MRALGFGESPPSPKGVTMAERIQALTARVEFFDGKEVFTPDLPGLVSLLAKASDDHVTVKVIEVLGKGNDGTEYRVLLEPVGVFKEKAPIGFHNLLFDRALGDILIRAGIATPEQIQRALAEQNASAVKERLGEVLVRLGIATPQQVREALLRQLGGV